MMSSQINSVDDVNVGDLISFVGTVEGNTLNKIVLITEIDKAQVFNETFNGVWTELSGIDEQGVVIGDVRDLFSYAYDYNLSVRKISNTEIVRKLDCDNRELLQQIISNCQK